MTEIIDLTASSPPQEVIILESDIDIVTLGSSTPQSNGKHGSRRERKKRWSKSKRMAVEEGEIVSSAEGSREQSRDGTIGSGQNGDSGGRAAQASGSSWGRESQKQHGRNGKLSLLERIEGLNSGRFSVDEGPGVGRYLVQEEGRKRRQKRSRSPRPQQRERRSRSPDRRNRDKDILQSSAEDDGASLFYIDVKPAELQANAQLPDSKLSDGGDKLAEEEPALLLPAHVSVFSENGVDPAEILPPSNLDAEDESYIEYLDYDDDRRAPGTVRYFEEAVEEAKAPKPKTVVCKNCGAEGEHKTYECPVLICLTCGARDEHSTRSCPISKTCFNCGMKGHINKTCPNRHASRGGIGQYEDCDRCGSRIHNTNECPTLWRIYEYVDDVERQDILRIREGKRTLALGQGGEGYIASDEWCYNCGGCGHLGDDCRDLPHAPDLPRESSAFGSYNTFSGPFYDASARPPSSRSSKKRGPRDWEVAGAFADGLGFNAPMDVGKQGRRKERARMEKRAKELEEEEESDDWFGGRARARSGGNGGGGKNPTRGTVKNVTFGFANAYVGKARSRRSGDGSGRSRVAYDDMPGPSQETDTIQVRGAAKRDERYDEDRRTGRHTDYSYYRGDAGRREERGPRYKGGYSR
ncbi:hypothetical protein AcW1_005039 [Taiwanofungus camphoratus]|nr:hypothetical protein AcW2_005951 [Antrodia cinnamomea]KAI0960555.1 hypothetical protein AcW1_005039 [Antrodia cinnamomea]